MIQILNIGVLASTNATDLQAVLDSIDAKELDATISTVISNKEDAYALERARKHDVSAVFIPSKGKEREAFDREVAAALDKAGVDLVLLIGFNRILSSWFVNHYKNRIVNIHPSLLPAFAGDFDVKLHEKVLASGVEKTGCTLHFVDETVDHGEIILQKEVDIMGGETPESLKEKVQKAEQETIIEGIKLFIEKKTKIDNAVSV